MWVCLWKFWFACGSDYTPKQGARTFFAGPGRLARLHLIDHNMQVIKQATTIELVSTGGVQGLGSFPTPSYKDINMNTEQYVTHKAKY